jgi:hypothetical protein
MNVLARLLAAVALCTLLVAGPARATSSLSFEGEGYEIDLEVGDDAQPTIATVRFHAPGDAEGVLLAPDGITVESFDTARQVLVLRYAGSEGVEAFTLSVQQADAVLETGATRVASTFDWSM